ncbi:chorismate mutase [Enterococcus timonensis]|uniref:chorismate mutase n=1 Tax=Enterococcus timonensis TaxID=1852364 RepID=UPI0008D95601|nr:chorismate mutase [Enterococcus timonensis]
MTQTEKEKMIAGQFYFAQDTELVASRKEARRQMKKINAQEDDQLRQQLVQEVFGTSGNHLYVEPNITFDYGFNIHVGENFYCNFNNIFLDTCPIIIGDNVMFGPNVQLYTATHPLEPVKRNSGLEYGKPIQIGDNAWFGGGVVILPGVTLGDNVVVGSGSVVTKSFGDNVVLGGNPARVIKKITENEPSNPLDGLRAKIDHIDDQLLELLTKRLQIVGDVAQYKAEHKLPILNKGREEEILARLVPSNDAALTPFLKENFEQILRLSKEYQAKIIKDPHHEK